MDEADGKQNEADGGVTAQEEKNPQPQRGGKRGKKKQKYKPLDLSSVPDPTPSAPSRGLVDQQPRQWQTSQPGKSYANSASSGGNRGGSSNWGRNDQGYGSGQRHNQSHDYVPQDRGSNVAFSKALVTLLRHGKPSDIQLDGGGYASVDDILHHRQFEKFNSSEKGISDIVRNDKKDRFQIEKSETGKSKIRATQGHSVRLEAQSVGLVPLTNPKKHDTVVHGTYQENWRKIKKQGLNRMTRTHVHFAIGNIGETHVTSGMRNTCDVVIHLDLEKALKDGLKFYESVNGVVLCEGDANGAVSPKYFKMVKKWDRGENGFKDINFKFEEE